MAVRRAAAFRGAWALLGFGLLAGCSVPPAVIPTQTLQSTITFSVGQVANETVDVTATVVDSSTNATVFSQTYAGQATPFSASYSPASVPVNVTMSVTMHLGASAALASGTNSTAGTTLTDASASFTQFLSTMPLFVVDNPTNPTVLVDVSSINSSTQLTLSASFPAGSYYLYQKVQMSGVITWSSGQGTSYASSTWENDTLSPVQWSAQL